MRRTFLGLGLLGAACASSVATKPTPFGERPVQCVLEVPSGAHVSADPDPLSRDVHISHPTLGAWKHTVDPLCSAPEHAPAPSRRTLPPPSAAAAAAAQRPRANSDCNDMPCTCATLPCNNWIDNAGYMLDPPDAGPFIGGFSTIMSVPGTPKQPNGGQTLFYFPGAENTDGTPRTGGGSPGPDRAILQPVLTYGPQSNCVGAAPASETGWCIASWYCCPKNLTVHSPYLGDVAPGESWLGLFNLTAPGLYETVSRNTATGQETKLSCPREGRNFNWADVTLEVYGAATCPMFAVGSMSFTQLAMWDEHHRPMEPQWLTTGSKPCGGKITVDNKTSITIEHS